MKIVSAGKRYWLAALAIACCAPAYTATVYKSVDDQGVVSFSDTRPTGDSPVETMQIDTPDPQLSVEDSKRLEAMRETTDRMAAYRREREQHRAEMRSLQADTNPPPDYGQADYTEYMGYPSGYSGSGYYAYPGRHPWRPGHRPGHRPGFKPRPEHPIARPPLRSPAQTQRGSNAQLMRPIVSPRR